MRAMCIHTGKWYKQESHSFWSVVPGPKYAEICNVIRTQVENGEKFYVLEGYEVPTGEGYPAESFIPIQDQETEVETLELELIHH